MQRYLTRLLPLASVAALCFAVAAADSSSDIVDGGPQAQAGAKGGGEFERIGPEAPLRVQCWQEGREIIDERKLYGMALKPLLDQASVSFKTLKGDGPSVHILSVDETTCLVRADS